MLQNMATQQLKELIIKCFVLDYELLKNGSRLGFDYFSQLLERIRDIRSSERRFNQKITDICADSFDYRKDAKKQSEIRRIMPAMLKNIDSEKAI